MTCLEGCCSAATLGLANIDGLGNPGGASRLLRASEQPTCLAVQVAGQRMRTAGRAVAQGLHETRAGPRRTGCGDAPAKDGLGDTRGAPRFDRSAEVDLRGASKSRRERVL